MSEKVMGFEWDTGPVRGADTPSGWDYLERGGAMRCVFSTTKTVRMGMGSSSRTHDSQNFWFVTQVAKELFEGRMLSDRHLPTGATEEITIHELVSDYTPELAYYEELVLPAMRDFGPPTGTDADEFERECTVGIESVTSLFGLALVYHGRHEMDRAKALLDELVQVKTAFKGKDQHLFNEFGIVLRKCRMYPEAVEYFERALEYVADDDHLFYNLARSHYENDEWEACLDNLIHSHRLNPGLDVANDLLEVIDGLDRDDDLREQYGKTRIPPDVAVRARQLLAAETGKLTLDEEPVGLEIELGRARSGGQVGFVELKRHGSDE